MKKLSIFIVFVLMILFSGCGVKYYYAKSKPFKPDKRNNMVRQCKTYQDVKFTSADYYRMRKKK